MNSSKLVLLFWAERGFRQSNETQKRGREDDDVDAFLASNALRVRSHGGRNTAATSKGAPRGADAPGASTWVNPSLGDATGLDDVTTERLVDFLLSDDCGWYLTNGEHTVRLLRNGEGQKNQDAVWTWFGDGKKEYCYRSTEDIKDVPGFRIAPDSGALTGTGWQLMHEVKDDPADPVLAEQVRAGSTWVNYGLFQLQDLEALMQNSAALGKMMSRNKGSNHLFCEKGIYKLYVGSEKAETLVGSKKFLTNTAHWTGDYNSKLLGTITMHTGEEQSDAIGGSDAAGSFSTITVTASHAAYKGEPGGVVFNPKTSAVRPLLHGSAVAITFDLGTKIEKIRIVRAAEECIVCLDKPPVKIPQGCTPLAACGHQDVCGPCLFTMHEQKHAKCPQCRVDMGGDSFSTLMRMITDKRSVDAKHAHLLEQQQKLERELLQVTTRKEAMDSLSETDMLTITSLGVLYEVAKEALYKCPNLELGITWALDKTVEQAKLAQEAKEKADRLAQKAKEKAELLVHDFGPNGVPWKIHVIVTEYYNGCGTRIEPHASAIALREYRVPTRTNAQHWQRVEVTIINYSADDLEFGVKYTNHEDSTTENCDTKQVQAWNYVSVAHHVSLDSLRYEKGDTKGDEYVLLDESTKQHVLRLRFVPYN